jgi:hypothetical protein
LAHVLCAVHCGSVDIPGTATPIPSFVTHDGRTLFPEFPAAAFDDFLVRPSSLHKRIQEKRSSSDRRRTVTVRALKPDFVVKRKNSYFPKSYLFSA